MGYKFKASQYRYYSFVPATEKTNATSVFPSSGYVLLDPNQYVISSLGTLSYNSSTTTGPTLDAITMWIYNTNANDDIKIDIYSRDNSGTLTTEYTATKDLGAAGSSLETFSAINLTLDFGTKAYWLYISTPGTNVGSVNLYNVILQYLLSEL